MAEAETPMRESAQPKELESWDVMSADEVNAALPSQMRLFKGRVDVWYRGRWQRIFVMPAAVDEDYEVEAVMTKLTQQVRAGFSMPYLAELKAAIESR